MSLSSLLACWPRLPARSARSFVMPAPPDAGTGKLGPSLQKEYIVRDYRGTVTVAVNTIEALFHPELVPPESLTSIERDQRTRVNSTEPFKTPGWVVERKWDGDVRAPSTGEKTFSLHDLQRFFIVALHTRPEPDAAEQKRLREEFIKFCAPLHPGHRAKRSRPSRLIARL